MTKEHLDQYRLNNGMIILGEPLDEVESVSFHFLLPAGNATLPDGCCGAGKVLSDWILRGAGNHDNRQLNEALDYLGIHRSSAATEEFFSLSASLEAGNLISAIDLFADILTQPRFDEDQFEPSRQLVLHELAGLEDDPQHKAMLLTKEQFYPYPYNRPSEGTIKDLHALTPQGCRDMFRTRQDWSRCIFALAGKYDFQTVCNALEKRFAHLSGIGIKRPSLGERGQKYTHHTNEGAQVHIGMMTAVPAIGNERYYDILTSVAVLSGGMSGRLFTEVREKRGLCYAVGARYQSLKDTAGISCYAGTMPDKAQETYDVIRQEFQRLRQGITNDELQRAKTGLKSKLIMQSESTQSRSSGVAGDYAYLGRVRTLDEIRQRLENVTIQSVQDFLDANPFENFTVVTIGPKEIHS